MQPAARVILIIGIPGAGKTTVARALAKRLPRAACIEGDLVQHHFTVTGLVPPGGEPAEESHRQLELRWRNVAALASNFAAAGFVAIVEHAASTRFWIEYFRAHLSVRPVSLVVLAPPLSVALTRDAARVEKQVAERFAYMDAELRGELSGLGYWLDTAELSVEDTVDRLLAGGIDAGGLD